MKMFIMSCLPGVFAQSMQSLVLQPPKQKISNAYLREFEKMKLAEEFA